MAVMTGERIVWAAVAAVLGEVLLAIGQPSAYLPVFMVQVASSAALAACITLGLICGQDALASRRAQPALAGTGRGKNAAVRRQARGFLRRHPDAEITVYDARGGTDSRDGGMP
jgi:hypothetical protein